MLCTCLCVCVGRHQKHMYVTFMCFKGMDCCIRIPNIHQFLFLFILQRLNMNEMFKIHHNIYVYNITLISLKKIRKLFYQLIKVLLCMLKSR